MKQKDKEKQTTKVCSKCGNIYLICMGTLNKKVCCDCNPHTIIPWFLEEDQESMYPTHTR